MGIVAFVLEYPICLPRDFFVLRSSFFVLRSSFGISTGIREWHTWFYLARQPISNLFIRASEYHVHPPCHRPVAQIFQDRILPHPRTHLLWSLSVDHPELSHQRQAQASSRTCRRSFPAGNLGSHLHHRGASQTGSHRADYDRSCVSGRTTYRTGGYD
jgi:hypothetical protein